MDLRWVQRVVLLALLLCAATGCNGPRWQKQTDEATNHQATPVRVTRPQPADSVELAAPLSGVVRATGQTQLAFQLNGLVTDVLVAEGQAVSQGQVLARLDSRLFAAQQEQAAGALAQAQAQLDLALSGTRAEQVAQAEAQVKSAEAQYAQAQADYERAQQLYQSGVMAKQALDAAAAGHEQARQALNAAQEQLAMARKGPRDEEIAQARAGVQQASGALNQAATQLDYATLTAPTAGVIVMRKLEPGLIVSSGTPVFELANLDELEVWTEVPESDLPRINTGDPATITFPAAPDVRVAAEIISIAPSAQAATRGFPVKLRLLEEQANVVPGMVAQINLAFAESPGGLVIPQRCLVDHGVYVVEDGRAVWRKLEVLLDIGESVFVDGLEPADQVIVNGQHLVSDGGAVTVVDALAIEELTRLEAK
ncbi:efflux RND transporter periplasmic adaptor subunit [bacterium]|nr:efflux RND transporter periplasmic adaptor subunit [bacterium]